jgi:uncharacterized protein
MRRRGPRHGIARHRAIGMFSRVWWRRRRTGAALVAAAEGFAVLALAMTLAAPAGAQVPGNPYQFMRRDYQRQQQRGGFFGGFFGAPDHTRRHRATPRVQRHVDYSHAPPPQKQQSKPDPNKPITTIVVMGGSMADWLAYGLEDAFSDSPNVEIVRKDQPKSGLLRYKYKSDLDWWHVAREELANQKANYVVMMLGVMDRQNIRESDVAKEAEKEAQKNAQKNAADASKAGQNEKDAKGADKSVKETAKPSRGVLTFRSPQWERVYTRRIDKTIAALKSKGVPVFWVGLPSIRGTKSTANAVYLNNLYRQRAERAGIVYIDVWDGFVDDSGKYSSYGPDYEGQTRRLRSPDGVFFTKYGARKLAHYVEREIRRYMANRVTTLTLPTGPLGPTPGAKSAVRPLAGPVLPLTAPTGNSDVLLGGAGAPPQRPDAIATNVLVKGNALSAPPGRADDFKWPPDSQDYGKPPAPPPAPEKTSKTNETPPAAPPAQAGAPSGAVPLTPAPAAGQSAQQPAAATETDAAQAKAAADAKAQAEAAKQAQEKAAQQKAAEAKAAKAKAAEEARAKEKARREAEARRRAAERARAEAQQGLRPPGRIETRPQHRPRRQSDNPFKDLFGLFGQ